MKYKLFLLVGLICCFVLSGCWNGIVTGASLFYDRKELSYSLQSRYIAVQAQHILFKDKKIFQDCNITVTSFNYDLLLLGQTPTLALKLQAESMVQNIPNIRRLINLITVEPPTSAAIQMNDSWITTKIRSRIIAYNDIDHKKIKVITEDGVVYLLGDVDKELAAKVVEIARETEGVVKVVRLFRYIGYIK